MCARASTPGSQSTAATRSFPGAPLTRECAECAGVKQGKGGVVSGARSAAGWSGRPSCSRMRCGEAVGSGGVRTVAGEVVAVREGVKERGVWHAAGSCRGRENRLRQCRMQQENGLAHGMGAPGTRAAGKELPRLLNAEPEAAARVGVWGDSSCQRVEAAGRAGLVVELGLEGACWQGY